MPPTPGRRLPEINTRLECGCARLTARNALGCRLAIVVREVLIFFEWILHLPEEYSEPFELYLQELENDMGREFLPSWERRAMQQGRQEVREEFGQKVIAQISRALEKRLNGGSQPYIANIAHLSDGERDELFDLLIDTTDTEKIKAWFAAHPGKKTSGN